MKKIPMLCLATFVHATGLVQAMHLVTPLDPGTLPQESIRVSGYERRPILIIQTQSHVDNLHKREEMRFCFRYAVRRISSTHADGSPAVVKILRGNVIYIRARFQEGSAVFTGRATNGNRVEVKMLNEAYEPDAQNPFYYEISEPNGNRYYLFARGGPGMPFGTFAFLYTADDEMKTREDFGFFFETDPDGTPFAIRTPHTLTFLTDQEDGGHELRLYRNMPHVSEIPEETRFVPPVGAEPREILKYMKPDWPDKTGLLVELIFPEEPYRWYRWVENPIGDYDVYYEDENREVFMPGNVRRRGPEQGQFTRVNGRILRGGQREVTTRLSERMGESWKTIRREIDVEGDVTVWTYTYWDEPVPRDFELKTEVSSKGPWAAFDYDFMGRREVEIRPVQTTRQVVEFVADKSPGDGDDALDDLLGAFTDGAPAGKRRVVHLVEEFDPPAPPEDIRGGIDRGEVTLHMYEHPDPGVIRDPDDRRPAVTTRLRHGAFVERTWFEYDVEHNGRKVTRRVTTSDATATHDDPRNDVRLR